MGQNQQETSDRCQPRLDGRQTSYDQCHLRIGLVAGRIMLMASMIVTGMLMTGVIMPGMVVPSVIMPSVIIIVAMAAVCGWDGVVSVGIRFSLVVGRNRSIAFRGRNTCHG